MYRSGVLGCLVAGMALSSLSLAGELSQADLATPPTLVDHTIAARFSTCDPQWLALQGLPLWRRDEHGQVIQCARVSHLSWVEPSYHWSTDGLARGSVCGLRLTRFETAACRSSRDIASPSHTQTSIYFDSNTAFTFGFAK